MRFPQLTGNISITDEEGTVVIAGDPEGLHSLARLLTWLADTDLGAWPHLPPGGRAHIHAYPRVDLSTGSQEVEFLRMDVNEPDLS